MHKTYKLLGSITCITFKQIYIGITSHTNGVGACHVSRVSAARLRGAAAGILRQRHPAGRRGEKSPGPHAEMDLQV